MPQPHDAANKLAEAIAAELKRAGQATYNHPDQDRRNLYRRAGRRAGRILHRPVLTYDSGRSVLILLKDWGETSPLEAQLSDARARNALERAWEAVARTEIDTSTSDDVAGDPHRTRHQCVTGRGGLDPNHPYQTGFTPNPKPL